MKVLFIGGSGNISAAASRLAVSRGVELWHLNRGQREASIQGVQKLRADLADEGSVERALAAHHWDAVVNFIVFTPEQAARDVARFENTTRQYVFISSASVYQKPPRFPIITESTPLSNPFWQYSQDKIACEELLFRAHRERDFPVVIVRPSLTYDTVIPVALGGFQDYTLVERIRQGRPIVVHGDGTSLWTMTHADDFAKGLVGLLGNPRADGHAFHITSDEWLTWNEIYLELGKAAGREPRIVHIPTDFIVHVAPELRGGLLGDKAHSALFDNAKIRSFVPDYLATIPFCHGIRRTIAWFEARPDRRRIVKENDELLDRLISAYGHAPSA